VLPFGSAGRQFFERYGARPERVFPCPGEPDYGAFEQAGPDRVAEAARRLRLAPGRRRIVYVGRLIGLKRVDLLAGAFARIAAERPEWDLLLVGDGLLRGELEARLGGPLAGRVRWAGFVNDPVELAAILKNGDLLVLPSDTDAWALVVNEAMAAGLAVITSDVVGAAEDLVRSGENGATFRRGDAESLTAALLEVTNPAAIDRLRAGSVRLLARWREVADPVAGFRAALRSAGVPGLESGGTGQGP
jgi:glycosyltransferase involved in cell wall biosynthesis